MNSTLLVIPRLDSFARQGARSAPESGVSRKRLEPTPKRAFPGPRGQAAG